jgi:hypothetical protein
MSELTRYQAIKIVKYLVTHRPWGKSWNDVGNTVLSDIQRILDENQSVHIPPLEPFVWYEATPENCARIPDGSYAAIKGLGEWHGGTDHWIGCWYYSRTQTGSPTYFMLINGEGK